MNSSKSISTNNEHLIKIIMGQTTYDADESREKLSQCNGDYVKVIRNYMGIVDKKEHKVKSVNQEIFRQIRTTMDESMRSYREKNPIDINHVRENFAEANSKLNKS